MFGFVSVEVFNPSAFWELHWTILSGREEGKIFHCPAPSHLEGFPRAPRRASRLDFKLSCVYLTGKRIPFLTSELFFYGIIGVMSGLSLGFGIEYFICIGRVKVHVYFCDYARLV